VPVHGIKLEVLLENLSIMNKQEQPKDKGLDTPAESNRDKHINFLETEETSSDNNSNSERLTTGSSEDSADDYGEISRKTKE